MRLFVASTGIDSINNTDAGIYDIANISKKNSSQYSIEDDEFIFDRTDVRAIFITLYTIVFCCCFFGKLVDMFTPQHILGFVMMSVWHNLLTGRSKCYGFVTSSL